ncbi:MAG TPA: hypothetical protein VM032_19535 [Vicinamibacterales bacterium]|nr:hypothetical protein [Vicinamibacterales bacterium]
MKLSMSIIMAPVLATSMLAAQAPASGEKVTVAGCLQRAQRNGSIGGTVVGTSASPATADDEANSSEMVNAFLLSEATPVVNGAPAAVPDSSTPTPGSTAAVGTSGRPQMTTFGLVGQEAELERHPGARLEVTGTIVPAASSGRGTGGAATATGVKRIQVESFKVVAEKCEAQVR